MNGSEIGNSEAPDNQFGLFPEKGMGAKTKVEIV
jgi:hypothetical protein